MIQRAGLSTRRSAALLLFASVCFATSGPLGKLAAPLHPVWVGAGRCLIAALILSVFAGRSLAALPRLGTRDRVLLPLAGVVLGAHFSLFLLGLRMTSLPAAVTLVSLEPVSVVVAVGLAFRVLPTRNEALGVAFATLGAVLVARGAGDGEHRVAGDLVVLGAVALYGVYVSLSRALGDRAPQAALSAAVYAVSGLSLAGAAFAAGMPFDAPPRSLWMVLLLGVVPTLGGHTLVQWAASRMPAAMVALVSPGETVGALGIAAVFMGTLPSPWEWVGAAVVLVGVLVTIRR